MSTEDQRNRETQNRRPNDISISKTIMIWLTLLVYCELWLKTIMKIVSRRETHWYCAALVRFVFEWKTRQRLVPFFFFDIQFAIWLRSTLPELLFPNEAMRWREERSHIAAFQLNCFQFFALTHWSPTDTWHKINFPYSSFRFRITTSVCGEWCQHSLQNANSVRVQRPDFGCRADLSSRTIEETVSGGTAPQVLTRITRFEQSPTHRQLHTITKIAHPPEPLRWLFIRFCPIIAERCTHHCQGIVQFPRSHSKVSRLEPATARGVDFELKTILFVDRELSFKKGDIIYIRREIDRNWYEGEHNAMVGLLPANYVEVISRIKMMIRNRSFYLTFPFDFVDHFTRWCPIANPETIRGSGTRQIQFPCTIGHRIVAEQRWIGCVDETRGWELVRRTHRKSQRNFPSFICRRKYHAVFRRSEVYNVF